jgi:hypothetical protein
MIPTYEIVAEGVFLPDEIIITSSDKDRKHDPDIDKRIEDVWNEKVAEWTKKGLPTNNGKKIRLVDASANEYLSLEMGDATYKDYIGVRDFASKDLPAFYKNFGKAYLPNTMGAQTILTTKDGKFLLTVRGGAVESGEGTLMTPGGYLEKKNVVHEALREIDEEILNPAKDPSIEYKVTDNACLGVVFDPQKFLNSIAVFNTGVDLTSKEIEQIQKHLTPNIKKEHKKMMFIDNSKSEAKRLMELPVASWDPQSLGHLNLYTKHVLQK